MKYYTLFLSKTRKDVTKFVVCCSRDWLKGLLTACWIIFLKNISSAEFFKINTFKKLFHKYQ